MKIVAIIVTIVSGVHLLVSSPVGRATWNHPSSPTKCKIAMNALENKTTLNRLKSLGCAALSANDASPREKNICTSRLTVTLKAFDILSINRLSSLKQTPKRAEARPKRMILSTSLIALRRLNLAVIRVSRARMIAVILKTLKLLCQSCFAKV